MKATILSISPPESIVLPEHYRVLIDLPYSVSLEISRPGLSVGLISLEETIEGEEIEIEGSIIFPKEPYELTELSVFRPMRAGLREASVWEVVFPRNLPIRKPRASRFAAGEGGWNRVGPKS